MAASKDRGFNPASAFGGLAVCAGLGYMLRAGFWPGAFFIIGFFGGLFLTANISLPVLYIAPRSLYHVSRGEMRWTAVPKSLIAPVIWCGVLGGLYLVPATGAWVRSTPPFVIGFAIGAVVVALSAFLDSGGRQDMSADYQKFAIPFWKGDHEPESARFHRLAEAYREEMLLLLKEGYTQLKPRSRLPGPVSEVRRALIDDCERNWACNESMREKCHARYVMTAEFVDDDLAEKFRGKMAFMPAELAEVSAGLGVPEPSTQRDDIARSVSDEQARLDAEWISHFGP